MSDAKTGLRTELIRLTRDLMVIESTDSLPEERARCFQLVRNYLDELPGVVLKSYQFDSYESLLALPQGVEHPEILLNAHLDVVEHPSSESYRSVVKDGRIVGAGAGDMKGQLAILLELFRKWHCAQPGLSLGLAITSDEERGGEAGVKCLVQKAGLRCGVAIIPDGGALNRITVEEKGILHLRLIARGHSSHAARPWLADNPLERLVRALPDVLRWFEQQRCESVVAKDLEADSHWYPTCAVTMMDTPNDSVNCVPELATATLDVRFPPPWTMEKIMAQLKVLLGDGIEVEKIIGAEPSHLAPDQRFVELTSEVTGEPVDLIHASGGSDGRFFAEQGIPVILSRPEVDNLHGEDEWIDVESMLVYFEICDQYIGEKLELRIKN
ncbi:MAG: M20/M25/M40 family metallo-hydrolase [Verrucomicrobiales bacterium]|nr:M20/M25/M40 family metallo-hydrolase [Verrucomicrobiales bacterium]